MFLEEGDMVAVRDANGRVSKSTKVLGWSNNWVKLEIESSGLVQWVNMDWLTIIQPLNQERKSGDSL